jgi:hypothetical protein
MDTCIPYENHQEIPQRTRPPTTNCRAAALLSTFFGYQALRKVADEID